MTKIHNFILRISKWYVWLFFFVAYLFFAGYVMKNAAASMQNVCKHETKIPDIEIGYTPGDLREMLHALKGECGETFSHIALVIDSFYPLAYGLFFFFSIVMLYYKSRKAFPYAGLYWFAIVCMVFDYLENSTLAYLVKQNGDYPKSCLQYASVFSGLKWLFAFICIALILVGTIRWGYYRFIKV